MTATPFIVAASSAASSWPGNGGRRPRRPTALGPVVGGWLASTVEWKGIFWLNVPIGLVLLPLARWRLAESFGTARRLDMIGVVLAGASLFVLVGGVITGGGRGWDRPLVVMD